MPNILVIWGDDIAITNLVLHDDADREFDYVKGAEQALDVAKSAGWTVVSVTNDWATVFGEAPN
jgi:hypothetical protein